MSSKLFDSAFMKRLETLSLHFSGAVSNVYTGGRRSRAHGSSVEFSNFREYNQGDDFRRIDWNAYARFEKFFIKLFLDEKQLNVRVFTDLSASMDFGTPTKFFAALRVSAALAYLAFRSGDAAAVYGIRDGGAEILCPRITSSSAFYSALQTMETLSPAGQTGLEASLRACRGMGTGDGISIVVTDLMSDEDFAPALRYLLYRKQQVVLVHILSREETEPDLEGPVRLLDSETSGFCELEANPEALACYRRALEEYRSSVRSFCVAHGIYYLPLLSDEEIENVLPERGFRAGIIQ